MARSLQAAGWARARALVGGWSGWVEAGLPTMVKPNGTGEPAAP